MSATTYPPPIRITPNAQPIRPCWLWDSNPQTRGWKRSSDNGTCAVHPDYTHWVPITQPPEPPPDISCESEVERLREQLDAACKRADNLERAAKVNEAIMEQTARQRDKAQGELEAAEQHVNILTEQRDIARREATRLISSATPVAAPSKAQKVHPWKPEDVPLGCWLRSKSDRRFQRLIVEVCPEAVIVPSGIRWDPENRERITNVLESSALSYEALANGMEHSTDGGKTWAPAGRVSYEEAA